MGNAEDKGKELIKERFIPWRNLFVMFGFIGWSLSHLIAHNKQVSLLKLWGIVF